MTQAWYQLDWIWTATGWLLAILGAALFLWSLFWDRARGRKRCPKCWYDMSGDPTRCPECDRAIRVPSDLFRTRRKWRVFFVAVAVSCIGFQVSMIGTPGRRGWNGLIPTAVLLLVVDDFRNQDLLTVALLDRLQHGRVVPWDYWLAATLELHRAVIDWNATVAHRPKWPVDIPLRVELRFQEGMASEFQYRTITMEWLDGKAEPASATFSPPHIHSFVTGTPPNWINLPAPQLGDNRYRFRVSVAGFGAARSAEVTISVRGVATIDEVIAPNNATESVEEVRQQLAWFVSSHAGKASVIITKGERWTPSATPPTP